MQSQLGYYSKIISPSAISFNISIVIESSVSLSLCAGPQVGWLQGLLALGEGDVVSLFCLSHLLGQMPRSCGAEEGGGVRQECSDLTRLPLRWLWHAGVQSLG